MTLPSITQPPKSHRQQYDVRKIVQQLRSPRPDCQLVAAHRGLRWNGVAENSKAAIAAAADAGLALIEVDVRMTSDRQVVIFHDDGLGRATDVAEFLDIDDVYSPFTGQGYNPLIKEVRWDTCVSQLRLKEEHGLTVNEGVLTLEEMLRFILDEAIDMVVMLDIKDKEAIPITARILAQYANSSAISALEWCIFKLDVAFYPSPVSLEAEEWFQESRQVFTPVYIPVYEPESVRRSGIHALQSVREFASRDYVVAFEIGVRSPGGLLSDILAFARSPGGKGRSIGCFGALGDLHPLDSTPMVYETGEFEADWKLHKQRSHLCFYENRPPVKYDHLLMPGEAPDGHDHRGDLAKFRAMGFNWVIADMAPAILTDLQARSLRNMADLLRDEE